VKGEQEVINSVSNNGIFDVLERPNHPTSPVLCFGS